MQFELQEVIGNGSSSPDADDAAAREEDVIQIYTFGRVLAYQTRCKGCVCPFGACFVFLGVFGLAFALAISGITDPENDIAGDVNPNVDGFAPRGRGISNRGNTLHLLTDENYLAKLCQEKDICLSHIPPEAPVPVSPASSGGKPAPMGDHDHDHDHCLDNGNDCCANRNAGEPATCALGYAPSRQPTSYDNCPNYECVETCADLQLPCSELQAAVQTISSFVCAVQLYQIPALLNATHERAGASRCELLEDEAIHAVIHGAISAAPVQKADVQQALIGFLQALPLIGQPRLRNATLGDFCPGACGYFLGAPRYTVCALAQEVLSTMNTYIDNIGMTGLLTIDCRTSADQIMTALGEKSLLGLGPRYLDLLPQKLGATINRYYALAASMSYKGRVLTTLSLSEVCGSTCGSCRRRVEQKPATIGSHLNRTRRRAAEVACPHATNRRPCGDHGLETPVIFESRDGGNLLTPAGIREMCAWALRAAKHVEELCQNSEQGQCCMPPSVLRVLGTTDASDANDVSDASLFCQNVIEPGKVSDADISERLSGLSCPDLHGLVGDDCSVVGGVVSSRWAKYHICLDNTGQDNNKQLKEELMGLWFDVALPAYTECSWGVDSIGRDIDCPVEATIVGMFKGARLHCVRCQLSCRVFHAITPPENSRLRARPQTISKAISTITTSTRILVSYVCSALSACSLS